MATDSDVQTQAATTANKLASAAVGISIAAFLVAYLQLFLGNLMSGHALWKTNRAAIGVLARHRSWRPSLGRIRIMYPVISLKPEELLRAARKSHSARGRPLHRKISHDRPRATWAQLVQALNITDPSTLVGSGYFDCDTIPSGIDVPLQRVRLFDLAQLALYLGCSKVEVDTEARFLKATGIFCTLKTEVITAFGNAVRFEGDLAALTNMELGSHTPATALVADRICLGQYLIGIHFRELKAFRAHLDILFEGLDKQWPCRRYYDAFQAAWPPSSIDLKRMAFSFADEMETLNSLQQESSLNYQENLARGGIHSVTAFDSESDTCTYCDIKFSSTQNPRIRFNLNTDVFTKWQTTTRLRRPSALILATLAMIPGASIGYPSKLFLRGFTAWCAIEAQQILDLDRNSTGQQIILLSTDAQSDALNLDFSFYDKREHMPFLGLKTAYSWLSTRLSQEYSSLRKELKHGLLHPNPHSQVTYNVRAVIMPWTLQLLADYRPLNWARRFRRRCRDTLKAQLHPAKLLWAQLILLDIAIRLQIKGSPTKIDGEMGNATELQDMDMDMDINRTMIAEGPSIVVAIMHSYHIGAAMPFSDTFVSVLTRFEEKSNAGAGGDVSIDSVYRDWDLHGALGEHCDFYNTLELDEASAEYARLAVMLKLRALFFLAFLMVVPDSTAVYQARMAQVQVPII